MPAYTEKRNPRFLAGQRTGNGVSYTNLDTSGRLTSTGCARTLRQVYIGVENLGLLTTGCSTGSLYAASILADVTGSIFAGVSASMAKVYAFNMGAGASPGSPLTAFAIVPKPTDADTSGSIIAYVDWTYGATPATTGSKTSFAVGIGYLTGAATTPSAFRTAASVGAPASYGGTACGLIQTACIGKLPSFSASDTHALVVVQVSAASAVGIVTASLLGLSVRLQYVSNSLGIASTE